MRDELGDRMKKNYENRTRILLPRRTYTIIRVDGKAFHTYTKGLLRPFDGGMVADMDSTAEYLCKNIQGAKCGFVQSDEISVVMTDFDKLDTDAWFDGNIQKIVSVAASLATSKFNQLRTMRELEEYEDGRRFKTDYLNQADLKSNPFKLAEFDARVFTIPSLTEVCNYFIWRQQDTVRNSISSVAQSLYSSKELHGKNMSEQQEMIFQKGVNWNDFDVTLKNGRFVYRQSYVTPEKVTRSKWITVGSPTFTQDQDFLLNHIPEQD